MSTTRIKSYTYQAVDNKGNHSKGTVDALNQAAAVAVLRQRGDTPLVIEEAGKGLRREIRIPGLGNKVKTKDLAIFARQFATLVTSGMSLMRSLTVLQEQTVQPVLKQAIMEVRIDVEGGVGLSDALARHSGIFPPLAIALIRAGEAGGFIDRALDQVAVTLEKDLALRSRIKGAMTYPTIVLAFSVLMVAAVLIFIVPIFEEMFAQLGGELPFLTQVIVSTSHAMIWLGPLLIVLGVTGTWLYRREVARNAEFRLKVDRYKLKMPIFGELQRKLAMSRFSRNLGTLLHVGVPVLNALSVVGATTGNAVVGQAMTELQDAVREGRPMSAPMHEHWLFPAMVTQMVEVGEETGEISQMLDKIADFYDREVNTATESLTASIEPIMVVVMGALVGGMIICLYLPMFTIYQNIQQ